MENVNPYSGMWGGISTSFGQAIGLGTMMYGNASGLTDKMLKAQEQADIRRKEQQKKYLIYGIIGGVILLIIILIIIKK